MRDWLHIFILGSGYFFLICYITRFFGIKPGRSTGRKMFSKIKINKKSGDLQTICFKQNLSGKSPTIIAKL